LGEETSVEKMKRKIDTGQYLSQIPIVEKRKLPLALESYYRNGNSKGEAIFTWYKSGGWS